MSVHKHHVPVINFSDISFISKGYYYCFVSIIVHCFLFSHLFHQKSCEIYNSLYHLTSGNSVWGCSFMYVLWCVETETCFLYVLWCFETETCFMYALWCVETETCFMYASWCVETGVFYVCLVVCWDRGVFYVRLVVCWDRGVFYVCLVVCWDRGVFYVRLVVCWDRGMLPCGVLRQRRVLSSSVVTC